MIERSGHGTMVVSIPVRRRTMNPEAAKSK